MSLIPKITRFAKLPELLKHKQEMEEKHKKGREDRKEKKQRPFNIEDEVSLSPDSISEYKIHKREKEPQKPKSKDDDQKGSHIDLTV